MKEKIKYLISKRSFHISVIIIIIAIILFTLGIIVLKYNVEGETNMPFDLTKITIISSADGNDKEIDGNKWACDVNQNNDIYLYFEKNKKYTKQEAINSILIDKIEVFKEKEQGEVKFYRPNIATTGPNFKNVEENMVQRLEYKGDMQTDLKNLKIANQGGVIAFRYANDKIAEYMSNDEVMSNAELLRKVNIKEEDLKAKLSFDLQVKTISNKEYEAKVVLDLPIEGLVEKGTTAKEITDLTDIVFKRVKN